MSWWSQGWGLSLADRPDRQTALQRELGAGQPATSLGRSGRRQLARPAGCLMSPTQFFTPYFSNKKAVRLQPQPSGCRALEPPGSTAAFPASSRVPRAGLGGSVGKHVGGIMWGGGTCFGVVRGACSPGRGLPPGQGLVPQKERRWRGFPSVCLGVSLRGWAGL